ncbi:MAG TPA: DUF983 domain-containing protein [Dehalococcoidia bacterium]|jgi:uncharacterized protein (DUF983 family)|nr:DUF983 domain-containing protein [Dehalococcoidia bacterium]
MVLGRCPRCGAGRIFMPGIKGFLGAMQPQCQVCDFRFLREAGYFLGAMYVSYGLGVFTVLPVAVFLALVLEWPIAAVTVIAILQTLLSVPLFLRFSRVLWLHVDFAFDPT